MSKTGKRANKQTASKQRAPSRKTEAAKAAKAASHLSDLLATAPATPECPIAPPKFITGPLLAASARVWSEVSAHLDSLNLYSPVDKYLLAAFCVYVSEFVAANEEVMTKGYAVNVKTISGDFMPRANPAVGRRDDAFKAVLELSKHFGFTPRHLHELIGLQKRSEYGPLFDSPKPPAGQAATPDDAPPADPVAAKWQALLDDPAIATATKAN